MRIGAEIIKGMLKLLSFQPLEMHYFWGRCIGWILRVPMRYRRDVAMINVSRSFPEKKYKDVTGIVDGFYSHLGRLFAETVWFAGSDRKGRLADSEICRYENLELLSELYSEGRSVIIMTSHAGNWELLGGVCHYRDIDSKVDVPFVEQNVTVVYKSLASKTWDNVMADNRCMPVKEYADICYVESREIMRFIVEHRDEPHIYIFLTDQCPYRYASVHTVDNFMNQPTKTMTGAASLAKKLNMAVCYMGMKERPEGGYDISFEELCRDAAGFTPEEIMNKFYALLERDIREQPWNYLWSHKRWKK